MTERFDIYTYSYDCMGKPGYFKNTMSLFSFQKESMIFAPSLLVY